MAMCSTEPQRGTTEISEDDLDEIVSDNIASVKSTETCDLGTLFSGLACPVLEASIN